MSDHTPLLTIFPGLDGLSGAAGGLDKAYVTDVQIVAQKQYCQQDSGQLLCFVSHMEFSFHRLCPVSQDNTFR